MQKTLKKVLSFLLVLIIVLGIIPVTALADEVQASGNAVLPASIDGLSIAYPYNTENIELTKAPVSRFDALTFESARNEVESAQMILTPNFKLDSFELTMNNLTSEKGNIIPGWAFDVFIQHYVSVTGAGNAAHYDKFETHDSWFLNKQYSDYLYHPRDGKSAPNGTYPNALIPQNAAIANGVNTIAAGQNGGIWVNLNVQDAAPGTYTGFATLTVNGEDMQIPVSVRIYDVEVPDEVHSILSTGIWWDQLEAGEGYVTQELADSYYNYLISKRISPWDRWNYWYTTDGLVTQVVSLASDPKVPSYLLYYKNDDREVNRDSVVATLTGVINKNIELAQSGSNVDLFKKAYFYFACVDEPAGGSSAPTYAQVQAAINVLDSVKGELAPMLDAYPDLKQSFLGIKNIVTGPDPTNAKDDPFYIDGNPDYSSYSALTSTYDSVIYCPQYQNMQTAEQRAKYADDTEVWWYGCCHPVAPYPTFHYNNPLATTRALGFMMYEYGISGAVYSSVNYWGQYTDNGISLYDYWNGYSSGTPGDQMLVYPGSDFGVEGPIGSMRIETIRESSEDYEYLWLLEQFGGSISAYTAGLYDGTIVTGVYDGHTVDPDGDGNTDSDAIYHSRRIALLSKLEELNVAANGATEIEPGQENFVRGQVFKANQGLNIAFEDANYATVSFDYKLTSEGTMSVILRDPDNWTSKTYGDYTFNSTGLVYAYGNYQSGITCEIMEDGYVHVTMVLSELQRTGLADNRDAAPENVGVLDIYSWTSADGYIDNVQVSMEAPVPEETEPEVTEPENTNRGESFKAGVGTNITFDNAAYDTVCFDYKLTGEGTMSVILRDQDNWTSKTYGDYTFNSTGLVYAYGNYQSGITCEIMEDGYVHVTMKLSELQRTGLSDNRNAAPENVGVLDIYSWTSADGYIDNVQVVMPCEHSYEAVVTDPTFTANGYTTYSCSKCGDSYIADETTAYTVNVAEWNIALADDVRANFHLNIDSRIQDAFVTVLVNDFGYKYSVSELATTDEGYYVVSANVAAAQMTEEISIEISSGEMTSEQKTYTIRQYAEYILTGEYDENTKLLVQRMLNYGAAAQTYFVYNTGNMANAGYEMTDVPVIPEAEDGSVASGDVVGIDYYGASLLYETKVGVRFYYTVTGRIENYTFTDSQGNTYEPVAKGGRYYVEVMNINPNQYDDVIEMLVTDGTNTQSVSYSPMRYISRKYYGSTDTKLVSLVVQMYQYHLAAEKFLNEDQPRGDRFEANVGITKYLSNKVDGVITPAGIISFEYKLDAEADGDKDKTLSLILRRGSDGNWTDSYQAFTFAYNGARYTYDNVTCEVLEDGYIRVTIDMTGYEYNDYHVLDFYDWSTVGGYVDNIQWTEAPVKMRGEAFEGGVTKTIILSENATENLSFDYKLSTDGDIRVILRAPDWNGFYGDFTFNANGLVWSNQTGITTEELDDGYIRVYVDFAQLNRTGCNDNLDSKPASVGVFDIYKWGTADGYIDNIQLDIASSEEEEPVIRGEVYNAGEKTNYMIDEGNYATISFEYRLTTDGEINVMLRSPLDTPYYGGFKFDANGEVQDYAGVECEKLDDGYIRVTVTTADVERANNKDNLDSIPATVNKICIYRDSTASGYIDNIQYVAAEETEMFLLLQKCDGTNSTCSARDYSNIYFSTTPFTSASDTLTLVVKTDCTSIMLRGMSDTPSAWSGTGVTKTLEDIGDGWKTVTWTLSEIVKGNDATTMNGFRIDGLVDGADILMKDILINGQTDWVGDYRDNYHGVVTLQ